MCAVNEQFRVAISSGNGNVIIGASAQSSVAQNSSGGSYLQTDASTKRNYVDRSVSTRTISQVKQSLLASDFIWSDEELNSKVTSSKSKSTRRFGTNRIVCTVKI